MSAIGITASRKRFMIPSTAAMTTPVQYWPNVGIGVRETNGEVVVAVYSLIALRVRDVLVWVPEISIHEREDNLPHDLPMLWEVSASLM